MISKLCGHLGHRYAFSFGVAAPRNIIGKQRQAIPIIGKGFGKSHPVMMLHFKKYSYFLTSSITIRDKWVPVTVISGSLSPRHGAYSGCGWRNVLQIRRVAVHILNKQLQTDDKGWSSSLGVGRDATISSPKNLGMLRIIHRGFRTGLIFRYNLRNCGGFL